MTTENNATASQEAMTKLGRKHAREVLAQMGLEEELQKNPNATRKDLVAFKQGQEDARRLLGR